MSPDRARLTPVDVVFFLVGVAILGALGPIYLDQMSQNLFQATPATAWFARLLIPTILLTVLALVYVNARQGVGSR